MTFKNFMYKGVLMITVLALIGWLGKYLYLVCLLYTSPSPRD